MQDVTQVEPLHKIETSLDGGKTRYSFFRAEEGVLRPLMDHLFLETWSRIVVGPCIEGAVFEIQFETQPKVTYLDGYFTVDLGRWHFHLCIGPTKSSSSEELRQKRPVAKAAMFETRGVGHGRSWGLRFWNGFGEQMMTVFLPNPRVSDDQKMLKEPDWNRLEMYYALRNRLFGEPVPSDYAAAANEEWPENTTS
jgi:hypothetical protein